MDSEIGKEIVESVKSVMLQMAGQLDDYLLKAVSARKGDIKTREDLRNYVFKCPCCKKIKPATEGILWVAPLTLLQTPRKDDTIEVSVSQKVLLVCRECGLTIHLSANHK